VRVRVSFKLMLVSDAMQFIDTSTHAVSLHTTQDVNRRLAVLNDKETQCDAREADIERLAADVSARDLNLSKAHFDMPARRLCLPM
jgi:hypothetical protein